MLWVPPLLLILLISCEVIHNLSSLQLSDRLRFLLLFGLQFGLPVHKPNFYKHFLLFENLAYRLKRLPFINADSFSVIIRHLKQAAFDLFENISRRPIKFSSFTREDMDLLKDLARNKDFVVTRPDRGGGGGGGNCHPWLVWLCREDGVHLV